MLLVTVWSGCHKLEAVVMLVKDHAPWTNVNPLNRISRTPADILYAVDGSDLVVDATGNDAFSPRIGMGGIAAGYPSLCRGLSIVVVL